MNATKNKYQITEEALKEKGEIFLNPPVGFIGRKGFQKFINEFPKVKKELTKVEYDKILANMVAFFGTVPTVPNVLKGIKEPDKVSFDGGFDKISQVLSDMGKEHGNERWFKASRCFEQGGAVVSEITNIIVAYLTEENDKTGELPRLFTIVMGIMTDGFALL